MPRMYALGWPDVRTRPLIIGPIAGWAGCHQYALVQVQAHGSHGACAMGQTHRFSGSYCAPLLFFFRPLFSSFPYSRTDVYAVEWPTQTPTSGRACPDGPAQRRCRWPRAPKPTAELRGPVPLRLLRSAAPQKAAPDGLCCCSEVYWPACCRPLQRPCHSLSKQSVPSVGSTQT